jgi:hypothetical protein
MRAMQDDARRRRQEFLQNASFRTIDEVTNGFTLFFLLRACLQLFSFPERTHCSAILFLKQKLGNSLDLQDHEFVTRKAKLEEYRSRQKDWYGTTSYYWNEEKYIYHVSTFCSLASLQVGKLS